MDTKPTKTTVLTHPHSPLLSLPPELQTLIYADYYPSWSLCIRGHFTTSSHRLLTPTLNLLLTCHTIHTLASPIFHSSYRGIVNISLTDTWLADTLLRTCLCTRYAQLLARTHTLFIDTSKVNDTYRVKGLEGFSIPTCLPNLRTVVANDAFRCVNVAGLVDGCLGGFGSSGMQAGGQNAGFQGLMRKVLEKRMAQTAAWCILAEICSAYDKRSIPVRFSVQWVYRVRIEGLEGTCVSDWLTYIDFAS